MPIGRRRSDERAFTKSDGDLYSVIIAGQGVPMNYAAPGFFASNDSVREAYP